MPTSPHAWLNRLTPEDPRIVQGLARERQEDRCEVSYARVVAPPCPVCRAAVRDAEWQQHRWTAHGVDDAVRPYGRADAREMVAVGRTVEELAQAMAKWRRKHPGLRLALAGEGSHPVLWRRFCVLDGRGQPVR